MMNVSKLTTSSEGTQLDDESVDRSSVSQARQTTSYAELLALLHFSMTPTMRGETTEFQHLRVPRGHKAIRVGQPFMSMFAVRSGFLKIESVDEQGEEKVLAFPMRGDLLGTDGIHSKQHLSQAVALSDCELVIVPFHRLQQLARSCPELELAIYGFLSRELCHERKMSSMLAKLGAEARVARFLANTAQRHSALGFSGKSFELRMTRFDIGSYLGITVETVSRTLTALEKLGYIAVNARLITILDPDALAKLRRIPPSHSRRASQPKIV